MMRRDLASLLRVEPFLRMMPIILHFVLYTAKEFYLKICHWRNENIRNSKLIFCSLVYFQLCHHFEA